MEIPFPPIFVINLSNRPDKWASIQEDFQKQGWPLLNRIDAVKWDPGWYGATLSHVKSITIAKENNLPWVLVLEDDCFPVEGAFQRFYELLPSLWQRRNEWDIFMGGITNVSINSVVQTSPPLLNIKAFTAHFCLIHSGSYYKILEGLTKEPIFIDRFYKFDPFIRMFCTSPHLAVQKPCVGDTVPEFSDYTECFLDSDNKLTEFIKEHEESCKS
uniref:Glycosyltransferase n=1 Tax=viral metagenome TaxID=1070528 RepID=A0A6C0KMW7_9ZZZZ